MSIMMKPAMWSAEQASVARPDLFQQTKVLMPFWEGTGGSAFDIRRRLLIPPHASAANSWAPSTAGLGMSFGGGANDKLILENSAGELDGTNTYTVIALFTNTDGATSQGLNGCFNGLNRYFVFWHTSGEADNTFSFQSYVVDSSQRATSAANASYFDGTPTIVAGTCDDTRNDVYAAKPWTLKDYSTGSDTTGGSRNTDANGVSLDFAIGNYDPTTDSGAAWLGDILLYMFIPRILSEIEIKRVFADPFSLIHMGDEVGSVGLSVAFTSANLALHHSGASDIGGAIATVLTDDALNNLWDDVSSGDASAGDTEFRCTYVKNTHATLSIANVKVEIETDPTESNWEIALGAAGKNGTETEVADEDTAPATPVFGTTALSLGTLAAGDFFPIWIKRIVIAGANAATPDSGVLRISADDPN